MATEETSRDDMRSPQLTARDFRVLVTCAGLTQASFGRVLNKGRSTANAWATGRYPVPIEIALLLQLMATTPDWRSRIASISTSPLMSTSVGAEGGADPASDRPSPPAELCGHRDIHRP